MTKRIFNKSDLVDLISCQSGSNETIVHQELNHLIGILTHSIFIQGKAEFRGFGSFKKTNIRPRKFINPNTKELSYLGETTTIIFNPSKKLLYE